MKSPFQMRTLPALACLVVFTTIFIFPLGQADVTLQSLGVQPGDKTAPQHSQYSKGPERSPFRGPAAVDSGNGPLVTISCIDGRGRVYQKDENGYADCLEGGGLQRRPSTFREDGPREVQMGIIIK